MITDITIQLLPLLQRCRRLLSPADVEFLISECVAYEPFESEVLEAECRKRIGFAYYRGYFRIDLGHDAERIIAFLLRDYDRHRVNESCLRLYAASICLNAAADGNLATSLAGTLCGALVDACRMHADIELKLDAALFLNALIALSTEHMKKCVTTALGVIVADSALQIAKLDVQVVSDNAESDDWRLKLTSWRKAMMKRFESFGNLPTDGRSA